MTFVFQNFLHSQIEYKFVNLLNKGDFENAFPLLCDYEQKNIPTHKYEQELTKIFGEDRLFQIKNFRVNTSFPIDTEKKEMIEKGFFLGYDLVYRDYKISLKRVLGKKVFIKNTGEKKCISIPENK